VNAVIKTEMLLSKEQPTKFSVSNSVENDKIRRLETLVNVLQYVMEELEKAVEMYSVNYLGSDGEIAIYVHPTAFRYLPIERLCKHSSDIFPWKLSCEIGSARICSLAANDELNKLPIPDEGGKNNGSTSN